MTDVNSATDSTVQETPGLTLDAWRGALVCTALVACALAYTFRLSSFLHAKEGVIIVCLFLMALLVLVRGHFSWNGCAAFAPLWVLLILQLARLYCFPVKAPSDALVDLTRCCLLLLTAAFVYDLAAQPRWQTRFLNAFAASVVMVALLGLAQYAKILPAVFPEFPDYAQRAYSVFGNQDLFGGYLAMGVPILIHRYLSHTTKLPLVGLAVTTPALLVSGSRSAWLAAAIGALVLLISSTHPVRKYGRHWVALGIVAIIITAATIWVAPKSTIDRVTQTFGPGDEGAHARLWFWHAAIDMFKDAPLVGVGPGNYAYWSPQYLGEVLRKKERNDPAPSSPQTSGLSQEKNASPDFNIEHHADHPHSEPLRILAETGLLGVLCCAWWCARLARRYRLTNPAQPEWGVLAAIGTFALFNAPFESVPHALGGIIAAAGLLSRGIPQKTQRAPAYLIPTFAVALCFFELWAVLVPSYRQRAADVAQLNGRPSLTLYERAVESRWATAEVHKNYAFALANAGRNADAQTELMRALDGLDTGDIYLALALLSIESHDMTAARKWASECLRRWPANEKALRLLKQIGAPAFLPLG